MEKISPCRCGAVPLFTPYEQSNDGEGRVMDVDNSCELCDHCLYIGDGDFWCDEKREIIASEFQIHEAQVCEKYEEGE